MSARFTPSLVVLSLLVACGASSSPALRDGATPSNPLNGTTWSSACAGNAITRIHYEDARFEGSYTVFTDSSCTTEKSRNEWDGAVHVAGTLPDGDLAIDLSFESFTAEMLTEGAAAAANSREYCGLADWTVSTRRDVLGRPCAGWAIPAGARSFERARVSEDVLLFGAGTRVSADTTDTDRPDEVDPRRVFRRVR